MPVCGPYPCSREGAASSVALRFQGCVWPAVDYALPLAVDLGTYEGTWKGDVAVTVETADGDALESGKVPAVGKAPSCGQGQKMT